MKKPILFILTLFTLTAFGQFDIPWYQSTWQDISPVPSIAYNQIEQDGQGQVYWNVMKDRRGNYYSSLGVNYVYCADANGVMMDSLWIGGKSVVEKIFGGNNEAYLQVAFYDSLRIGGNQITRINSYERVLYRWTPGGALTQVVDLGDTLALASMSGPGQFDMIFNNWNAGEFRWYTYTSAAGFTPVKTMGMIGFLRSLNYYQGGYVLMGSCLDHTGQVDTIAWTGTPNYTSFFMMFDGQREAKQLKSWEDITCPELFFGGSVNHGFTTVQNVYQSTLVDTITNVGSNSIGTDFILAKWNEQGRIEWLREVPLDTGWGTVELENVIEALGMDPMGNVYMGGRIRGTVQWVPGLTSGVAGKSSAIIVSYDAAGNFRWVETFETGGMFAELEVLGVDELLFAIGIYDTVTFAGNEIKAGSSDIVVGKIIPSGISVVEEEEKKLLIYPNPTSGVFRISLETPQEVIIWDIQGNLKYKSEVAEGSLDISAWPSGVYFLKVGNRVERLVVSH